MSSLRRLFRANRLSYKRIRKSCRHLRDPLAYEFFREEVKALQVWADTGEIDLCYGDEMGVSRQAVVPYGWQPVGKSEAFMPATPSGNLTTLGFFYGDNRLESYVHQGAMSSAMFVKCVDDFASRLSRKTVLILDNASTHKSALVASRLAGWRSQGLYIQYIPAYCPELNLIECLWKQPGGRCHQISLVAAFRFSNTGQFAKRFRVHTATSRHKIPHNLCMTT